MISYFLAALLGWYFVIMGLFLFLRRDSVIATMKELMENRALMMFVGVLTLIFGLLMVLSHNLWVMAWPVIVTVIAWLLLIGGIVRLFFPDRVYHIWNKVIDKAEKLIFFGVVSLIIGLFLLYKAYFG